MNLIHRAFFDAANRRNQLYMPYTHNAAVARAFGHRTVAPRSGPANILQHGRFYGLGAEPDYGSMLMNPTSTPATSWLDTVSNFAKQIVPVYQQTQLLREQAKRRAAGLPPLQAAELAPTVRVQAGVDPSVLNLGKIALYGGLGVGAALLIKSFMR